MAMSTSQPLFGGWGQNIYNPWGMSGAVQGFDPAMLAGMGGLPQGWGGYPFGGSGGGEMARPNPWEVPAPGRIPGTGPKPVASGQRGTPSVPRPGMIPGGGAKPAAGGSRRPASVPGRALGRPATPPGQVRKGMSLGVPVPGGGGGGIEARMPMTGGGFGRGVGIPNAPDWGGALPIESRAGMSDGGFGGPPGGGIGMGGMGIPGIGPKPTGLNWLDFRRPIDVPSR